MMLVMIISMILEGIASTFSSINNSLFMSLFALISIIIIYPFMYKDIFKYLKYVAIIGIIYDIVYTNTFFLNMIVFTFIGMIIIQLNKLIKNNFFNNIIVTIICIICYRLITYIILVFSNYLPLDINLLITSIYSSLILNIIYTSILYLIMDRISKKYRIKKII